MCRVQLVVQTTTAIKSFPHSLRPKLSHLALYNFFIFYLSLIYLILLFVRAQTLKMLLKQVTKQHAARQTTFIARLMKTF